MNLNRYSLSEVAKLRSDALAEIRRLSNKIERIAEGIIDLDSAVLSASEKNIDELQGVVSTARRLASLIDGGAAQ